MGLARFMNPYILHVCIVYNFIINTIEKVWKEEVNGIQALSYFER